ncbi:hypothetical protein OOT46_18220 [Aquabacterium sp. A7-Y]|uniref:hypothetical protein n=1 Tax=Aquabacterium sp. A7-Y TaxID=1349605 RepID=UPI00223D8926|nr:hypothetical protein [Aquabacterium sp. A7-Y]MCW7539774.1 hypothetical protein [Aquabacterium sp. A7-Y]
MNNTAAAASSRPMLARALTAFALAAAGWGCTTPPAGGPEAEPERATLPPVQADRHAAYEAQLRQRAQAATRQRRLAEAALNWELLTLLRPDVEAYNDRLAETRRQIRGAVADQTRRAEQAQRRGDLERAASHYLAVLALQPELDSAAQALRAIERERNRRNYLGKYSRITLGRRLSAEPAQPAVVEDAVAEGRGSVRLEAGGGH